MNSRWLMLVFVVGLGGCSDSEPLRLTGGTMGTSWSISIADQTDMDLDILHQEVMQELAAVNAAMSTWDPDSEISRFNRIPAGCMQISADFAEVMQAALLLSRLTDGAYDVSLGPLIDLWGFGAGEAVDAPTDAQINTLLAQTGFAHLQLDGQTLCKDMDSIQINLSSIAKGFGVDVVAEYLSAGGMENYLVEIGGELLARGDKNGVSWTVGVENPASLAAHSALLALPLENQAVATSGDYRNFFILDGRRYSHIIDARTGRPVDNHIASVTVIASKAMLADGWATALMTFDPERAMEIADNQGLAVLLMLRDGDQFENRASSLWLRLFGDPG